MSQRGIITLVILLAAATACAERGAEARAHEELRIVLPLGDAAAGRRAFVDLSCASCHTVAGDAELQAVVSANPGPELGPTQAAWSGDRLATSIIAPSHDIAAALREELGDELSPMGDYSHALSVRQLVDLVAYLRSLGG